MPAGVVDEPFFGTVPTGVNLGFRAGNALVPCDSLKANGRVEPVSALGIGPVLTVTVTIRQSDPFFGLSFTFRPRVFDTTAADSLPGSDNRDSPSLLPEHEGDLGGLRLPANRFAAQPLAALRVVISQFRKLTDEGAGLEPKEALPPS